MFKRNFIARLKQLSLDNLNCKDSNGVWIESQANYFRDATIALRKYRVYQEDTAAMRVVKATIERRAGDIRALLPGEFECPLLRKQAFAAIRRLELKK